MPENETDAAKFKRMWRNAEDEIVEFKRLYDVHVAREESGILNAREQSKRIEKWKELEAGRTEYIAQCQQKQMDDAKLISELGDLLRSVVMDLDCTGSIGLPWLKEQCRKLGVDV